MIIRFSAIAVLSCLLALPVFATDQDQTDAQQLPRIELMTVLDAVSKKTGKVFVVERNIDPDIVVGQVELRKMDYDTLLIVLRNNQLAAVNYDDITSIVSVDRIRQYPLPLIEEEDDSIADEEWVTMLVDIKNADARLFVPILRPMLPKQGHLVGHPDSNMLTIVDRYANLKRVLQLIRKMDAETPSQ